mmetsp:Transcript_53128/g.124272  ORF Transcript_53128/g.124272 Transcript_53128/m.124272 type:complete len:381 (+) Transcript_53128:1249-2391(+)
MAMTRRSLRSGRSCGALAPLRRPFRRRASPRRASRTHSSRRSHQLPPRHPQVAQREQRDDLRGVLLQPPVAHFGEPELPLDHPERMLDLGPDAGLHLLHPLGNEVGLDEGVEQLALARAHGHMPGRPRRFGPLVHALVARIAEGRVLLAVQQLAGDVQVVDVGRCAHHRVHQAGCSIHADVGLHPEVPVVALLGLAHLRVALTLGVLGRARRGDQRRIHRGAAAQHQALVLQQVGDDPQHVHRQVMPLQQVAEPKDRRLVGQPCGGAIELGELAVQRHVVQRFFHRRITQPEPLLQVVDAQHGLDAEGWPAGLGLGVVRRHDLHQHAPWHHAFHLFQELALARLLGRQVQTQAELLHDRDRRRPCEITQRGSALSYADLP